MGSIVRPERGVHAAAGRQTWRFYYYAGARRTPALAAGASVAVRTRVSLTDTLQYLFTDQLGSTSVASSFDGSVVTRQSYYPWGKVRSAGALPTDHQFTGAVADATGLIQMAARYYDPSLNRFISADTIVPGAGNPQALNRYSFVLGNPLKYTDPSGHDPCAGGGAEGNEVVLNCGAGPGSLPGGGSDNASSSSDSPTGTAGSAVASSGDGLLSNSVSNGDNWVQESQASNTCSFSGDTLVATANGEIPIDAIVIGDHILAYDQQLGSIGYYNVTATWKHVDSVIVLLNIGGEQIETTPEHPFFTEETGWTRAINLWSGIHVRRADGSYGRILEITVYKHSESMYNLTVALAHTYFVGVQQWLVHNMCPDPGDKSNTDNQAQPEGAKQTEGTRYGKIPDRYENNGKYGAAVGWPVEADTPAKATARIDNLTVENLQATGTTLDIAQSWVDQYEWAIANGKGNVVAENRLLFMQQAVNLLGGDQ